MLKDYFQLFRIPNLFTVPPDILGGYFVTAINTIPSINYYNLLLLSFSSVCLYIGGLITNDLLDVEKDKAERPNRPLSSGRIKKSTAVLLSILFFGLGVFLSLLLTLTSTVIAFFLTFMILLYNYKLKDSLSRPYLMGGIRSLNVIYGASSNSDFLNAFNPNYSIGYNSFFNNSSINLVILTVAVFIHIFTLTFLSKRETMEEDKSYKHPLNLKKIFICYVCLFLIIIFLGHSYLPNKLIFLVFIGLFLLLVTMLFFNRMIKGKHGYADILFLVKNMIILLIVLDSSFVAGSSGIYFGIISIGMIIPCVIIGKKVQMT